MLSSTYVILIVASLWYIWKEVFSARENGRRWRAAHGFTTRTRYADLELVRLTRCNDLSPDGVLRCSDEVGHAGWHNHHGPVSWYFGEWAEDDHPHTTTGRIPW